MSLTNVNRSSEFHSRVMGKVGKPSLWLECKLLKGSEDTLLAFKRVSSHIWQCIWHQVLCSTKVRARHQEKEVFQTVGK